MITDADVKKMKKIFVTKEDLSNVAHELIKLIQSIRTELKTDITDFKDSILTEIIKLRDDVTIITGYRDLIEDHDKRIEKLETAVYQ